MQQDVRYFQHFHLMENKLISDYVYVCKYSIYICCAYLLWYVSKRLKFLLFIVVFMLSTEPLSFFLLANRY